MYHVYVIKFSINKPFISATIKILDGVRASFEDLSSTIPILSILMNGRG